MLGNGRVPDLRSIFLRGLNTFDPSQPARDKNQQDPQPNRAPGDYQADAFQKHTHKYGTHKEWGNGIEKAFGAQPGAEPFQTGEAGTESETRPKNSAVYYYVKIN
jgi:hypothetical protein